MEQLAYDEHGACEQLGNIGRTKLYELTGSGEIRAVKIGRRTIWPAQSLQEYLDRLMAQ